MTIFARGTKLYAKTKAADGTWKQLATGFAVGDEAKARRWLEALERKVEAARASGATQGPLTVSAYAPSAADGTPQHQVDVPVTVTH